MRRMNTLTPALPQTVPSASPMGATPVSVESRIMIPGGIDSLAAYRRWAESDAYPQTGWISYLNGTIWVDPSMEEFISHNRIKQAFNGMFYTILIHDASGCWVPDRMLLVNEEANLSTEPDGLFYFWETMRSERLRLVPGKRSGYTELEGTPDTVLEIISESSKTKDMRDLRDLYWKAQIPEYWLVDARTENVRFDILRHAKDGYEESPIEDGWVRSDLLQRCFRIERSLDPVGLAQFVVAAKSLGS
jgi:Uma2 family endonuclease